MGDRMKLLVSIAMAQKTKMQKQTSKEKNRLYMPILECTLEMSKHANVIHIDQSLQHSNKFCAGCKRISWSLCMLTVRRHLIQEARRFLPTPQLMTRGQADKTITILQSNPAVDVSHASLLSRCPPAIFQDCLQFRVTTREDFESFGR